MKKTVLSIGIAAAFIVGGTTAMAGEVAGLEIFETGETALASEVNGNFTAVKTAVDDNNTKITTLEGVVGADNTQGLQAAVAGKLDASVLDEVVLSDIAINKTAIGDAETGLVKRVDDLEAVSGGGDCPDDMVSVGPICFDKTEHGGAMAPTVNVTQRVALETCLAVGKRLPTNAEWSMAAVAAENDASLGIVNMADGVYEWVADWTGNAQGLLRGDCTLQSACSQGTGSDLYIPWTFSDNDNGQGPNAVIGFRCAK